MKVAKPNQDMRFDVPTVGLRTLKELVNVEASAFAFEAGKTIFLGGDDFIQEANRKGIVIYGIDSK